MSRRAVLGVLGDLFSYCQSCSEPLHKTSNSLQLESRPFLNPGRVTICVTKDRCNKREKILVS